MANPNFALAGGGQLVDSVIDPSGTAHTKAGGNRMAVAGYDAAITQLMDLNAYISPPILLTFAATTGTLSAGAKYYRVSATTALGETVPGTEASYTALATTGITLSWPQVAGATGYKVYGRGTGAELLMATVTNGTTTTWTDDGSVTPSGAMPTLNTAQTGTIAVGQKAMAASEPVVIASDQTAVPVAINPTGTPIEASNTGAASAITATLAAATSKLTYITGFQVTGLGATAAGGITVTITGIATTMSFVIAVPAGVTLGATPLLVVLGTPIPGTAVNTAVVVNVPSFGAGNTLAAVAAQGFQL